jgi:predicted dehydrogenase
MSIKFYSTMIVIAVHSLPMMVNTVNGLSMSKGVSVNMKNGKIGVGILGLGGRGVYFGGRYFGYGNDTYLAGLCDISPNKLEAAKRELGEDIPATVNIDEFLAIPELDAVVVCTPDFAHEENAIKVLQAKKHLYLEKPMAQTIEGCDRIINEWKDSDTVFTVGLELRYCSLMKDTKAIIDSGAIGKIIIGNVIDNVSVGGNYFYHNECRKKSYIKNLLLQKGTHSLDLANWLIDASPVKVYCSSGLDVFGGNEPNDKRCATCNEKNTCPYFIDTTKFKIDYGIITQKTDYCVYAQECDTHDNSVLLVDYDNGARLSFIECHFTPEYTREFMFIGTKGKLTAFYNNQQDFKIMVWKCHEPEPVYYYPKKQKGAHGGGDEAIVKEFIELVKKGKPCMVGILGARDSAAIAAAAEESSQTGMPVSIPPAPMSEFLIR